MTAQIDLATASQLFDSTVTVQAQNKQKLMNTITERHGTTGDATNIPVSALIEMQGMSFAPANIPVTPVANTNVVIVPNDYKVKTVIGNAERTLFNYDMIVDQGKDHALAAGRTLDSIKINAIYASSSYSSLTADSIDIDTGGTASGMNAAKLEAALAVMEDQGWDVSNHQCSLWLPALAKPDFMSDDKVVNFFYNDEKPLVDNVIKSYLDVDIRTLGSKGINKIPIVNSGGIYWYVPLVHRDAIVQIFNRDVKTSITQVQQEDRYELLTVVTTGASIIQLSGIVLIQVAAP